MILNFQFIPIVNKFFDVFCNEHNVNTANAQLVDYQKTINDHTGNKIKAKISSVNF